MRCGRVELGHGIYVHRWCEVGVAHRHFDRRVAEELLEDFERHAFHDELAGERVPKHVL